MADNGLAQAIHDCILQQFALVPEELGPNVVVDPDDPATFPTDSGAFKKQCLVDDEDNFIGFVGPDGVHLEQDEGDDEVGPPIVVADGGEPPTTTEEGTNGQFECQKVLDDEGNLIGMVGPAGYAPIASTDLIKTEGEVIAAGTVITDDSVDPALLDENGALLADYTVQAGESFIFDGDEACAKSAAAPDLPDSCKVDPEGFDNTLVLEIDGQDIRFSATAAEESGPFNFAQTNGDYIFSDSFPDGSPATANGDTFEFPGVYEFTINNCEGSGCCIFEGAQEHLLVPSTGGIVGLIVFSEYQLCDTNDAPLSGWVSNGVGGNKTWMAVERDHEVELRFRMKVCRPNGTYRLKMRLRATVIKGYTTAGWSLRTQTSTFTKRPDYIALRCCPLPVVDPLKVPENTAEISAEADAPLA